MQKDANDLKKTTSNKHVAGSFVVIVLLILHEAQSWLLKNLNLLR
ncbi:hypothetical protein HSIEG1_1654 [Enterococcus sp. HSIEG1]|nr:hypothetical protein HSIEG1_1654 [Enterococcus sp. HSIEG1]